jgi:hypothetical protein
MIISVEIELFSLFHGISLAFSGHGISRTQRPPCSAVVFRGGKPHTAKPRSAWCHGACHGGGPRIVEVIRAAQRRKEFMADGTRW